MTKRLFGLTILILLGFTAYVVLTTIGMAIGMIFLIIPWWQIVIGTVLGSAGVLLYLVGKQK